MEGSGLGRHTMRGASWGGFGLSDYLCKKADSSNGYSVRTQLGLSSRCELVDLKALQQFAADASLYGWWLRCQACEHSWGTDEARYESM